ncbi:MAG: hypothetical protein GX756_06515 [Clostridiales bacterium]|nr:hypothetical protein [Clostridiales bacterium]
MRINNVFVKAREFEIIMSNENGMVKARFMATFGISESSFSWYSYYGGNRPIDELISICINKIIPIKVKQALAIENGVIKSWSYDKMLDEMHAENKRLAQAQKNGKPTFGKTKWEENEYYDYHNANLEARLSSKLMTTILSVSYDEAYNYYLTARQNSPNPEDLAPFEGNETNWRNEAFREKYENYINQAIASAKVEYLKDLHNYNYANF